MTHFIQFFSSDPLFKMRRNGGEEKNTGLVKSVISGSIARVSVISAVDQFKVKLLCLRQIAEITRNLNVLC